MYKSILRARPGRKPGGNDLMKLNPISGLRKEATLSRPSRFASDCIKAMGIMLRYGSHGQICEKERKPKRENRELQPWEEESSLEEAVAWLRNHSELACKVGWPDWEVDQGRSYGNIDIDPALLNTPGIMTGTELTSDSSEGAELRGSSSGVNGQMVDGKSYEDAIYELSRLNG
ncbi:hypothetical protein F0562_015343 [Nyssa sinensis]|uniref:Uncharacterized protein n=1 Tax=Nyssa sinensis TaxID=561372 RepID=A0A5J4ZK11_9ASTE|nr:hypothetical protein F0562_015343 [Nyssa sinensis]